MSYAGTEGRHYTAETAHGRVMRLNEEHEAAEMARQARDARLDESRAEGEYRAAVAALVAEGRAAVARGDAAEAARLRALYRELVS